MKSYRESNLSQISKGIIIAVLAWILIFMINGAVSRKDVEDGFLRESCSNYFYATLAKQEYNTGTKINTLFHLDFYRSNLPTIAYILKNKNLDPRILMAQITQMEIANILIERNNFEYSKDLKVSAENIISYFHELDFTNELCFSYFPHYLLDDSENQTKN